LKRFACTFLFLLALGATARAEGIAIRWDSCKGFANRNFACDRTTGSELLVGSFSPPPGIDHLAGIEVLMHITSADGSIPAWWRMWERGSCRSTSLSASLDMSDQVECDDPWSGQAGGGLAMYQVEGSAGVTVKMVMAVPNTMVQQVQSGQSYAAFKLRINHLRTSGPGACAGCETPMCVRLEELKLTEILGPKDPASQIYPVRETTLTNGIPGMGGSSQVATWQGGTSNCGAGTAKPSTWSQLKDRYRPR
jgi:hypothetical protein